MQQMLSAFRNMLKSALAKLEILQSTADSSRLQLDLLFSVDQKTGTMLAILF